MRSAATAAYRSSVPFTYWGLLSEDDRLEYMRLSRRFFVDQKLSALVRAGRERREVVFMKEVLAVLQYIERSSENTEVRSIVTGLCFHGPFVCINTRALKGILCRCKSSINGLFQELGYGQRRARHDREFVMLAMPSLRKDLGVLRQWTIRQVADHSMFCFVSKIPRVEPPSDGDDAPLDTENPPSGLGFLFQFTLLVSEPPQPHVQSKYGSGKMD
jgi:hypothetical protein